MRQQYEAALAAFINKEKKMATKIPPRNNRIRELREASKLTQAEVAKLLDVDNTTVSKHESGDRGLTSVEIEKYANLFKVDSYELFIAPEADNG